MNNSDSEDYNDFDSSDEEERSNVLITSKKNKLTRNDPFDKAESDEESEITEEEEEVEKENRKEKEFEQAEVKNLDINKSDSKDDNNEDKEGAEKDDDNNNKKDEVIEPESKDDKTAKLKKRLQFVNALKKTHHKTGVVYLSSIPPYMKPAKMRQILSRFGEVDRLFLKREDEMKHRQRVKSGGNKKIKYEEGWAEFIRKRDAKLCASTLNGNIIGGKKGNFYHDDILNVKYLPGFKWADLTEQIARENDIRQAKFEMEMSQANKLNAEYIRNVEKSKMLQNMQKSKKRKQIQDNINNNATSSNNEGDVSVKELDSKEIEIENNYRKFKQRRVNTNRADAPSNIKQDNASKTLDSVLNTLL